MSLWILYSNIVPKESQKLILNLMELVMNAQTLEAEAGIEPAHGGFAIRNITTLLLGLNESYCNVRTKTYQGFF
jgi:hypothetical protein